MGLEPSKTDIVVDSSLDATPNIVRRKFVQIKEEHNYNKIKKQLRVTQSMAIRTESGLHSILPPEEYEQIDLSSEQFQKATFLIDLESEQVTRKRVKAGRLSYKLMELANEAESILIGHIALAAVGKNGLGHAFAFCATEDFVYYIDPQLYNGLTNKGEPVFFDVASQFNLLTQYDSRAVNGFADDCFYLIHHRIPKMWKMQATEISSTEKRKFQEVETPQKPDNDHIKKEQKIDEMKDEYILSFEHEEIISTANNFSRSKNKETAISLYEYSIVWPDGLVRVNLGRSEGK